MFCFHTWFTNNHQPVSTVHTQSLVLYVLRPHLTSQTFSPQYFLLLDQREETVTNH